MPSCQLYTGKGQALITLADRCVYKGRKMDQYERQAGIIVLFGLPSYRKPKRNQKYFLALLLSDQKLRTGF